MEAMAFARGPMRLQDISQQVGIHASTVLRFLKTLMDQGYVGQHPQTSHYYLTMKLCRLGEEIKSHFPFRSIVRPYLERLSADWKESTFLAVEQNREVVYIDAVDGPDHMLRTLQRIGRAAPLNSTGVGKCILSEFDDSALKALIAERGLAAPTPKTLVEEGALRSELARIRESGFAVDDEECELGVRCVAAPLRDFTGRIVAAISISGPVHRMDQEKMQKLEEAIGATARRISTELGYS